MTDTPNKVVEFIGIYEADAGLLGELYYLWGKLVLGRHCSLCDISHNLLSEKDAFKALAKQLQIPIRLLHLNERPPAVVDFTRGYTPCLIARFDDRFEMVLSSKNLAEINGDESGFFAQIKDWLKRLPSP